VTGHGALRVPLPGVRVHLRAVEADGRGRCTGAVSRGSRRHPAPALGLRFHRGRQPRPVRRWWVLRWGVRLRMTR
jgi:hypothetical protein